MTATADRNAAPTVQANGGVLAIEWACTRLVQHYNLLNDAGRFAEAAACFAAEGSYLTPMLAQPAVGREAILGVLKSRPAGTFRHFVTNLVVEVLSPVEARGHSYLLIALAGSREDPLPVPDGPALTGEVHEHFVLTGEGWRFGHRVGLGGIQLAVRASG